MYFYFPLLTVPVHLWTVYRVFKIAKKVDDFDSFILEIVNVELFYYFNRFCNFNKCIAQPGTRYNLMFTYSLTELTMVLSYCPHLQLYCTARLAK